eukprot:CAMPEP_0116849798 /NCGR_PEP_ID=MMETSP0418-20121206/15794_1 /TAXON_ID=1158023 /ORGANISM="Astrosyne radiata, Strain 13vi08-1A" /LENGTH=75 /DNA_ID=CAMNT_0004481603 /DNA_START=37 /DNA_END=260 /DNA_ORIENTATION=+
MSTALLSSHSANDEERHRHGPTCSWYSEEDPTTKRRHARFFPNLGHSLDLETPPAANGKSDAGTTTESKSSSMPA